MTVCGPGVVAHVYNLSIRKTEAGGSRASLEKEERKRERGGVLFLFLVFLL